MEYTTPVAPGDIDNDEHDQDNKNQESDDEPRKDQPGRKWVDLENGQCITGDSAYYEDDSNLPA